MKHTLLLFFLISTIQTFSQNKNQPIGFKENKGQIIDQKGKPNTAVKYLLNSNGLDVQLKKNGFSYDVYEVKKTPVACGKTSKTLPYIIPEKNKETKPEYNLEYIFHRIDIDFVNSNSKVELITDQKSNDFDNYYNVPNKPEGITGVYQYKQITYKNIYPNIDVVFSVPNDPHKTVEYNFVIHPKGKISDIQLKFSGAETDLIANKIQMNVRFGKMEETLPASWIEDGSSKKEISINYTKIKKDIYGFTSSDEVSNKTVVIDPVPTRLWGTYYGDGDNNVFTNIGNDSFGNIYFTGYSTSSSGIFASSGAYQTINNSDYDGIIAKFDSNGQRIWGTYYGGESYDAIKGLKVDKEDNFIVAGITLSKTNIATINSYRSIMNNNENDAFLAKFNSSGAIIWGSYFGGFGANSASDVDIDVNNNIYIVGSTRSSTNISINNNFQTLLNHDTETYSIYNDGFLAKFNPNGNLIWSTYVGGESDDFITSVKVDSNYLVLGGHTTSKNHIATPGTFQQALYGQYSNGGIIYKFDLNGNRTWSTYYGGESPINYIRCIETDDENNIYIGGQTYSKQNIATPNSFDEFNDEYERGLLAKLNTNGQRIWGTYFGSSTIITSIKFHNNSIYIGGMAGSMGRNSITITTPCAYKRNFDTDGYLGKFSKNGKLEFGTAVGGFGQYSANKICFTNNDIIIGGDTFGDKVLTDANSYQANILGNTSFYLIKFKETTATGLPDLESNSPLCIGKTLELKASGGTNYSWTGPNGFTSRDQNPTITNATTLNSGEYSCAITGTGGCDDTKNITVVIGDIEKPVPDITTLPIITGDCNTIITTIPTATDICSGAITGSTTNPLSYSLPGTYTIMWNYDDGNGNISHQNQTVTITIQPLLAASTPQAFCIQQNATLADIEINGQTIKWYNAQTGGTLLPNTTLVQNGTTYYASQTINGCESERTPVTINIQNTPPPTGNANQPFCSAQNPTIANLDITGNSIKWYDSSNGGSLLAETATLADGKTYYASQIVNTCESPRFGITVSIVNTPAAPTLSGKTEFCKTENATLNNIQITGQNLKWYDTSFSAAVLPNTTLLEDNKAYYVSQTVGCESDRTPILVRVYDTALPTGSTSKQFCMDENATLASIGIIGTNVKWYDSALNGSNLPETTVLENATYYVTQTENNCESKRLAVTIKIQDNQPPAAASPQRFCIQKKASLSDIDITGENIKWFDSASSDSSLSESTLLENGITYYASQTINMCESNRIPITIQILEATSSDCINFVDELPYPKYFTPNNDTFHDTWTIDFAYLAPNTGIRIFDRYGKFIKEIRNNATWDGNYLGQQEPAADYWFTVTRLNGTEFRGHFSLKR